ncbi:MAG: tetratricopeptide repeat protein [Candidatus Thorarchaeota archaeon]
MSNKIIDSAMQALEEGRPLDAIALLEPVVKNDDEDVDALVCLGMAYVQAEIPDKAVVVLQQAEELVEQHYVVELFLGRALWALGKMAHAEDRIREAFRLDSSEPEVWLDLGRIMFRNGQYRDALEHLNIALEKFPDEIGIRGLYALTLYRLGDFTAATVEWGKVHRLNPELMAAISNYAYLLLIQKRSYEASPFVGRANTVDPTDYRSQILLGELRLQSNEYDGAIACFNQVLDQDPSNIEALSRLSYLSYLLSDDEKRNLYLARAEAELGRDPESWRGLCGLYSLLGMSAEYIDCLIRWTRADEGAAAPWVLLAVEYDRLGRLEPARNAWRRVFELRGYVKILCPGCEKEVRLPYDESVGFDVYQNRACQECGTTIIMPSSLAVT